MSEAERIAQELDALASKYESGPQTYIICKEAAAFIRSQDIKARIKIEGVDA